MFDLENNDRRKSRKPSPASDKNKPQHQPQRAPLTGDNNPEPQKGYSPRVYAQDTKTVWDDQEIIQSLLCKNPDTDVFSIPGYKLYI